MPKRTLQGVVVSDKQDKTVIVRVERRFTHPAMGKTVRRTKKYHAHDESNEYHVGDIVWIEERRPLSRLKRWEVVQGEKAEERSEIKNAAKECKAAKADDPVAFAEAWGEGKNAYGKCVSATAKAADEES